MKNNEIVALTEALEMFLILLFEKIGGEKGQEWAKDNANGLVENKKLYPDTDLYASFFYLSRVCHRIKYEYSKENSIFETKKISKN